MALLDCGASGIYMDKTWAAAHQVPTQAKEVPEQVHTVDGSLISSGPVDTTTLMLSLQVGNHQEHISFDLITSPNHTIILGIPWFIRHNPYINWVTRTVSLSSQFCHENCFTSDKYWSPKRSLDTEGATGMSINTVQGVPDHYLEFQDVFQKPSKPVLPPHREYDCAIPLEPGTIVPFGRMYSLTEPEREVLKEYLDENIQSGLIVPSSSPAGAPLFFVPKKTKDLRPCLDFRGLNKITIKDRYPLPLIRDILEAIRGAQRFTKLDLRGAYHLLRIKEGDEWKTAFRTPFGHFEYRVMPFGLTNAPAIFQRFMDSVFSDLLNQTVVIYLDDILIYSRNPELHSSHVKQVLQRLRAHQLFCKPEKCEFDMTEVKYLGYHLSPTGIAMDQEKVQAILEWPSPSSIKETQCFLGLANFYRQFILDFARLTSHITHTLKKENLKKGFVWTEAAEAAFQELKRVFTQAPILRHPDTTKQFIVVTDASERAIGAVLLQRQEDDGLEHPVFYLSHILSTAEQHYSVLERELLALKTACLEWRQFLMGSKEPFEVRTDHRNLQCLRNFVCQNSRQARWAFFFSQYDFFITYIPGSQNILADALSRRYPECTPSSSQYLLEPRKIIGVAQSFLEEVQLEYANLSDHDIEELRPLIHKKQGYFYYQNLVFLPTNKVQEKALQMCHDSPVAGHRGIKATQELLSRFFWWPTWKLDVERYVQACPICAQIKIPHTKPAGLLQPLPVPPAPWHTISTDFMCSLPPSAGNRVIMVTVDSFTKMAHFTALKRLPTSQELSQIFIDHIFRLHGLPHTIISDRGPQYISRFWRHFCKTLNISRALSSGFHPQTNGQTERLNQGLEQYLRCFCNSTQSNWNTYLSIAEFSYNNSVHSASKVTPFFCSYGFHPTSFPTSPQSNSPLPAITYFSKRLLQIHRLIRSNLLHTKRYMKKAADKRRATNPDYHLQDKVWLSSKFLPSRLSQNKFTPRYYGPFRILQLVNPVTVRLHLPHTWKIHPVFHVSQLKPYVPDPYSRQFPCPPPVLVDDVPEYEVQEICDSRLFHKRLQYLIHWKGYPLSECSWEDASSVHAPRLIQRFHCLFPLKPGPSGGGPTVAPRGAARAECSAQAGHSAGAAQRVSKTRRAPSLSCTFRGPRHCMGPRSVVFHRLAGVS
ncbi:hypothetical protein NDU88_004470 [Pleurodeles waltl]|uniref:Gypsy retrotransposon integrase-like protein 1 n=1 Tax=Pleurodeles waltl TaxID=8319 RepID=A0AAV7SIW7_PLEWA|nr:hypothetical protein NDU88_004470 [Pleurodeles waltl]